MSSYYDHWREIDIHAPMTLNECRLCCALVTDDGQEHHLEWHQGGNS